MKISEIITDKYKLRIPPTVYYELLANVIEAEEEQEQEQSGDLISRQYLLDNCVVDKVTMPYVPISKIQEAPSVNQQPICEERERGECPYYAG